MNDFHIKRINGGKHVLQIDNLTNFKQAKELLVKCNTEFYTYTLKTKKPIIFLLKDLDSSYNENEVLEELKSINVTNIEFTKVIRFSTSKSRQNNKILSIFIVQMSSSNEADNLKRINYLFH